MTISSIREQIIVPLNGYPNYFINSFGFVFRKAHEVIRENGFVHSLKELQLARYIDYKGKHSPASKPICIKDKEGQIISTYASINHAAINVGLHRGTIEKCLKNQRRHRFKRWTFHAL